MAATVDTKKLENGMKKLQKAFGPDVVLREMGLIAEAILKKSIDSPIPSDTRFLANSATSVVEKNRKAVVFGFNRAYAAFQDAPGRSAPHVIKPRKKKWLYVPITQAGRRHRLGANPKNEGLIFGGFVRRVKGTGGGSGGRDRADYILAKEVVIPIKSYGSAIGPNHYFSETVKRNVNWSLEALSKRIKARLKRNFKEGGKP
jgi:hypothetical protein